MRRLKPPRDPVTLTLDGQPFAAERGEPVAVSLLAANHLVLARSPKFHRPRGPACLRAACDGCLARVDGSPNVMTCRIPATENLRVETQNVVGSREVDLLRVADWFFPEGLNHHELLAGVPGLERVMQTFARRITGLGRLPERAPAPRRAARRQADALVVGAGPSGMAAALALTAAGRRVEVIEEDLGWGGCLRALVGKRARDPWEPLVSSFREAVLSRTIVVRTRSFAAGLYGDDLLVATGAGLEVLTCRTLVLGPGAHDGVLPFPGNDVPGVVSARAAGRLVALGISLGQTAAVVVAQGGGPFGEQLARAEPGMALLRGVPVRVGGSSRVREVVVSTSAGEQRVKCAALVIDAPRAPAYELCEQAGAELARRARGYVVETDGGQIRPGIFAVGEVAGTALDPAALTLEAAAVAKRAHLG